MLAKFFGTSKKLIERNTNTVINAIKKNDIDIVTHLNSKMKCNVVEIAKVAAEKGTLIEINEKHCDFSKEEIAGMLETKVNFIVSSDAHKPAKIGKFTKVEKLILENNIPESRIVNLNKSPNFLNQRKIKNEK